ncbi:MAG: DUF349 domain-containing protein [Actinomycetes bacterium]
MSDTPVVPEDNQPAEPTREEALAASELDAPEGSEGSEADVRSEVADDGPAEPQPGDEQLANVLLETEPDPDAAPSEGASGEETAEVSAAAPSGDGAADVPDAVDEPVVSEAATPRVPTPAALAATPGGVAAQHGAESAAEPGATGTAATPDPEAASNSASPAGDAPARPVSDPADWGRVGEDGTVFVRQGDAEREVGSYPGATPAEALAYFGRKYDELVGQVDLLDSRVHAGRVNDKEARASLEQLREAIPSANAVGDLDGLLARLTALEPVIDKAAKRNAARREAIRNRAKATKEAIVVEAEALVESTRWKADGDRLKELFEQWKAAPRLDKKTDDELWGRFRAARTAFDKRRRAHFASLDAERGEVAARKEKLVKEAESLATSTDWGPTAGRFRTLMDQWKSAGRAGRDEEEQLWQRFKAAQDAFFTARNATFEERDSEYRGNLEAKEALLVEAEKLVPVKDLRATKAALREIQERWEKAGRVPRSDMNRVEGRLRRVEDAVRQAEEAEWRRTNPEARARAQGAVDQLQQAIAGLQERRDKAAARGDDRAVREAEEALEARKSWLVEAEKTLAEFS